jgi:FixJ family two-component response regulator
MQAHRHVADDDSTLLNAIVKWLSIGRHNILVFKSWDELLAAADMKMPGWFQVQSATGEYGVTAERVMSPMAKPSGT